MPHGILQTPVWSHGIGKYDISTIGQAETGAYDFMMRNSINLGQLEVGERS